MCLVRKPMPCTFSYAESAASVTQSLIRHCIHVSNTVIQLKRVHALVLKTTPLNNCKFLTCLLVKLLKLPSDDLAYAHHLFDGIPHKTNSLWASLVLHLVRQGQYAVSMSLFAESHRVGLSPSRFVFSAVLNACARTASEFEGRQVHARALLAGCLWNEIVQTALMDMYGKCGDIHGARSVFDGIGMRDVVTWTAMIRGYAKMGMMEDARRLFDMMDGRNVFCWTTMVAGYANIGDMDSAMELYDKMEVKDVVTWVSLISGFGKIGDVARARQLFDEADVKDATCWAAMLCCYAKNGYANEALDIYRGMRKSGVSVSEVAMVGTISACTQLVDVKMAEELDKDIDGRCCRRTIFVSNALIHMHSRCGSINQAQKEFDRMDTRDVVSYGALIAGLADHGKAPEALDLFQEMIASGISPNQVTFVSVLNACSHAGLVEEGLAYYDMMIELFNIKPQIEHYSLIIDLLGRAGELERAYDLVVGSDHTALDAGVWGALLGACRVYGNPQLGEVVARKLFSIEAQNDGNYVLLASIFASTGRWMDAEKVRRALVMRGMTKSPGRSIYVNKVTALQQATNGSTKEEPLGYAMLM